MKKIVPNDAILIPDEAKRVFKGKIYDVYQWPQKIFDGSIVTFEMLKRPDTVTVIPVVDDRILTIKDEQPFTGVRLSFPGGRVDSEDDGTLSAAERELKEETGYVFDSWRLIKVWQPHTKLEWFIFFYLASRGRKVTEPKIDAGEKISAHFLTFEKAKSFVAARAGYLGESKEIFDSVSNLDELLKLPDFEGKLLDL